MAQLIFLGVFSCAEFFTSVWQSTQVNMLPWMESLNFCGSTCRLTVLPMRSWVRVASLWGVGPSSAGGWSGVFVETVVAATGLKKGVGATPAAQRFRKFSLYMSPPADS